MNRTAEYSANKAIHGTAFSPCFRGTAAEAALSQWGGEALRKHRSSFPKISSLAKNNLRFCLALCSALHSSVTSKLTDLQNS